MTNVTYELLAQIVDGAQEARCDHLALKLGKTDFNLVQPGRVSPSKMECHVGMVAQERIDQWRWVQ
jgi:hypothetical protein